MKTSTTTALSTVSSVNVSTVDHDANALAVIEKIELMSRAELQAYAAEALATIGLAPERMKTTRCVRALLRLAAVLEDASGHDRSEFLEYAGKAWDRQGLPQGKKVKPSFGGSSNPALPAHVSTMGNGASKAPAYSLKK